eukprot:6399764-Pyramimonas_sp.AAC.1
MSQAMQSTIALRPSAPRSLGAGVSQAKHLRYRGCWLLQRAPGCSSAALARAPTFLRFPLFPSKVIELRAAVAACL